MKYAILGVAAIVMILLGGYLINEYGDARYKEGQSDSDNAQLVAVTQTNVTDRREQEKIANETKDMPIDAIIDDLSALGILRVHEDY